MTNIFFSFISFVSALLISGSATSSVDVFSQTYEHIQHTENALKAHIGVAIYNTGTQTSWSYKGDVRIPLMSTFKTLACAKLLHDEDAGKNLLIRTTQIEKEMLVTYSPVLEQHIGKQVSAADACEATMRTSDNTAANTVLETIGGSASLTNFLQKLGDNTTQLDRVEPHLNEAKPGDIRDSTTPDAMINTLNTLAFGNVLSKRSKIQLIQWMQANQVSDNLLRAVLPAGWEIADRSGAGGYGSRGITAIVWPKKHAPIIVAIYITQTDASFERRNQAIADIGATIFSVYNR